MQSPDDASNNDHSIVESVGEESTHLELSTRKLLALTCSAGGLQLIWSAIFSNGTSYLMSLGVRKSHTPLIWAMAPLCGTFVQPLAGAWSDTCRSRYGRRRPFILGGALGVSFSLLGLAFIEELLSFFSILAVRNVAIVLVLLLNLSIQPLQSGIRALMVDACPPRQQIHATAWAGRFVMLGNIVGFFAGSIPLSSWMSQSESLRFRFLSLLSCAILSSSVITTLVAIPESPTHQRDASRASLLPSIWEQVRISIRHIPHKTRWVCQVQFFSWMSWFAFLFYSSTYIQELHIAQSDSLSASIEINDIEGITLGNRADLCFALVALASSIFLPRMLDAVRGYTQGSVSSLEIKSNLHAADDHLILIWATSSLSFSLCMLLTFFVNSTSIGTILVAMVGLSWAVTQWIPLTLISTEISSRQEVFQSVFEAEKYGHEHPCFESGILLGLYNAAISLPQILAALMCWAVFSITGNDAVGWILRCSGFTSLTAFWLKCQQIRKA